MTQLPQAVTGSMTQGIGWFVRRTVTPSVLTEFYKNALGLTVLREWDQDDDKGGMLWAGHYTILETNVGEGAFSVPKTLAEAGCVPVFSTYDDGALQRRFEDLGVVRQSEQPLDDVLFYPDSDGYPFGIVRGRPLASAAETLDGIEPPLCCLQQVIQFSSGPASTLAADYADLPGLTLRDTKSLDAGEDQTVRFVQSGFDREMITDRKQAPCVWILRVYHFDALEKACDASDMVRLNTLRFKGGQLDYYLDREQNIFGFQERFASDPDRPTTQLIEDVSARAARAQGQRV